MDLSQTLAAVQRDIEQLATDAEVARAQCGDLQGSIEASKAAQSKLSTTIDLVEDELALTLQEQSDMQCRKRAKSVALQTMHDLRMKAKEDIGSAVTAALLEVEQFESEAAQFQVEYCADHLQQQAAAVAIEHADKKAQLHAFQEEAAALHGKYKGVKAKLALTQQELQDHVQQLQRLSKEVVEGNETLSAKQQQLSNLLQQCQHTAQGTDVHHLLCTESSMAGKSPASEQLRAVLGELMDDSRAAALEQSLSDELAALTEEAAQTRCCIAVLQHEITNCLHPTPPSRPAPMPGGVRGAHTFQQYQYQQMHKPWPAASVCATNRPAQALGSGFPTQSWTRPAGSMPTPYTPTVGKPATPMQQPAAMPNRGAAMPDWREPHGLNQAATIYSMPASQAQGPKAAAYPQPLDRPAAHMPSYASPGQNHTPGSCSSHGVHRMLAQMQANMQQPTAQGLQQLQKGQTTQLQTAHTAQLPGHGLHQAAPSPEPLCSMYSVQEPDDDDAPQPCSPAQPAQQQDSAQPAPGTASPSMALVSHAGQGTYANRQGRGGALVTETVVTHTVRQSPSTMQQVVLVRQVVEGVGQGPGGGNTNTSDAGPAKAQLVIMSERVTEVQALPSPSSHTRRASSMSTAHSTGANHQAVGYAGMAPCVPAAAMQYPTASLQAEMTAGHMQKQDGPSQWQRREAALRQQMQPQVNPLATPVYHPWPQQPYFKMHTPAATASLPPTLRSPITAASPVLQTPAAQLPAAHHLGPSAVVQGLVLPGPGSSTTVQGLVSPGPGSSTAVQGRVSPGPGSSTAVQGRVSPGQDVAIACVEEDMKVQGDDDSGTSNGPDFSFLHARPRAATSMVGSGSILEVATGNALTVQQQKSAVGLPSFTTPPGRATAGHDEPYAGSMVAAGPCAGSEAPHYGNSTAYTAGIQIGDTSDILPCKMSSGIQQPSGQRPHDLLMPPAAAWTQQQGQQPALYTTSRQDHQAGMAALGRAASANTGSANTSSSEGIAQQTHVGSAERPVAHQTQKRGREAGQGRAAETAAAGRGGGRGGRGASRSGKRAKTNAADGQQQQQQVDMFGGGMTWTGL